MSTNLTVATAAIAAVSDANTKAALTAVMAVIADNNAAINANAAAIAVFNGGAAKGGIASGATPPGQSVAGAPSSNAATAPKVPGRITSANGNKYTLLNITNQTLSGATHGSAYSATLGASGGKGPYTWTAVSLPAGLSLSSSGVLSGTIAAAGAKNVIVTVTDSISNSVSKLFSLAVA